MKKPLLFVILGAALPACLAAASVDYATYLLAEGSQSQFTSPSAARENITAESHLLAAANLANGTLRILNRRDSGIGGLGTQALFYDTITFASSAFHGTFGATYNLNLTARYGGAYNLFSSTFQV